MEGTTILEEARAATRAGVVVLPVRADGTKAPAVSSWKVYQSRRPSTAEHVQWAWATRCGLGVVAGRVSGVEVWDFDDAATFEQFVARAGDVGLGDVVARLRAGYEDVTPRQGRRWVVRVPEGVEVRDRTLARRPEGDTVRTLIELPTFNVIAPSNGTTHPTGLAYTRVSGSFATLPTYTTDEREALIDLARSFDAMPTRVVEAPVAAPGRRGEGRPGDAYNAEVSWAEVLEPHGWRVVEQRGDTTCWRRPGKAFGLSATTNYAGSDLLWVFSSSTVFEPETSYSKFAAYALLTHGGDYAAAARALNTQGYGAPLARETRPRETRQGRRPPPPEPVPVDGESPTPVLVTLADVVSARVAWLWPSRLALGALSLWVGDGGWGKSRASHDLAARVSKGEPWPDGLPGPTPSHVILLSAEDALDYTLRPNIEAAGGDMARVHVLTAVRERVDRERMFSLERDIAVLEAALDRMPATLIIVDPVSSYFGRNLDSNRDTDVRSILAPLVQLAERRKVAVLGIMHVGKSSDRQARHRVLGSVGFVNAARMVAAVGPDPDNPERRLVATVKSNLCPDAPTLAFRLAPVPGQISPRVVWEAQHEQVPADIVLSGRPKPLEGDESTDAKTLLEELLETESWPMRAADVEAAARAHGLHVRSLQRAAHRMGVKIAKQGFRGGWTWYAPEDDSRRSDDAGRDEAPKATGFRVQEPRGGAVSSSEANTVKHSMFSEDDTKTTHGPECRLRQTFEDDTQGELSSSSSSQNIKDLHEDDTLLRRRHAGSTRAREAPDLPAFLTEDDAPLPAGSSDAVLGSHDEEGMDDTEPLP